MTCLAAARSEGRWGVAIIMGSIVPVVCRVCTRARGVVVLSLSPPCSSYVAAATLGPAENPAVARQQLWSCWTLALVCVVKVILFVDYILFVDLHRAGNSGPPAFAVEAPGGGHGSGRGCRAFPATESTCDNLIWLPCACRFYPGTYRTVCAGPLALLRTKVDIVDLLQEGGWSRGARA